MFEQAPHISVPLGRVYLGIFRKKAVVDCPWKSKRIEGDHDEEHVIISVSKEEQAEYERETLAGKGHTKKESPSLTEDMPPIQEVKFLRNGITINCKKRIGLKNLYTGERVSTSITSTHKMVLIEYKEIEYLVIQNNYEEGFLYGRSLETWRHLSKPTRNRSEIVEIVGLSESEPAQ